MSVRADGDLRRFEVPSLAQVKRACIAGHVPEFGHSLIGYEDEVLVGRIKGQTVPALIHPRRVQLARLRTDDVPETNSASVIDPGYPPGIGADRQVQAEMADLMRDALELHRSGARLIHLHLPQR